MFIVHTMRDESLAAKRFSERKSARSFARRSIRGGANFAAISERDSALDTSDSPLDSDTVRNVYVPSVLDMGDGTAPVRTFRRIDVGAFAALVRRNVSALESVADDDDDNTCENRSKDENDAFNESLADA